MADGLHILTLSDGRAGIDAQAIGLAEAIARLTPATITRTQVNLRPPWGWLPGGWVRHAMRHMITPLPDVAADIIIGCGRQSLYLTRHWKGHRPGFVVQLQNPRGNLRAFDVIVPPLHDGISADTAEPMIGAPNRITAQGLQDAATAWPQLGAIRGPKLGVLIGGRSKRHTLSPARARTLAAQLLALHAQGVALMVTLSRRTPAPAARILNTALAAPSAVFYDGHGPNPYLGILAHADALIVTGDSTNMLTEAATAGKPLLIAPIDGHSRKHTRLHDTLITGGWAQPFTGTLDIWTPPPFTETDRVAARVLARYQQWRGMESPPM